MDPIKAAKYLARQRERLKKEKILLDKLKTVPERVRRVHGFSFVPSTALLLIR